MFSDKIKNFSEVNQTWQQTEHANLLPIIIHDEAFEWISRYKASIEVASIGL